MNPSAVLISFFMLLVSVVSMAGIGGSSGGSGGTAGIGEPKYVRAEVCDADGRCRQVTYKVRDQESGTASNSATGLGCEKPQSDSNNMGHNCVYKVPNWLKKLNSVFGEVVEDETFETGDLYKR